MASRSDLLQTAQNLVSAYNSLDIEAIMGVRSADCVNTILPASLGFQAMNNEEYAAFFSRNLHLLKDFHLAVHDTLVDEAARKVSMHLTSSATTGIGDYSNEYMVTLHMTEDGRKTDRFDEFADSKYSAEFLSKLYEHKAQTDKANS
ncbi:MAG: hypothetical protein Q9185_000072 [Variospora sp. 1 TL-2023]